MNPISYARYLDGDSTTALSRRLGVSRQYISRLEQGLYDKPSDTLLRWACEVLSREKGKKVSKEAIEQLYREWQWTKRESAKINRTLRPVAITEFDRIRQPEVIYYHTVFSDWRTLYWTTPHAFCVDMCLHPSPVTDYEEGITSSMPKNLVNVLTRLDLLGEGFKTGER